MFWYEFQKVCWVVFKLQQGKDLAEQDVRKPPHSTLLTQSPETLNGALKSVWDYVKIKLFADQVKQELSSQYYLQLTSPGLVHCVRVKGKGVLFKPSSLGDWYVSESLTPVCLAGWKGVCWVRPTTWQGRQCCSGLQRSFRTYCPQPSVSSVDTPVSCRCVVPGAGT